MKPSKTTTSIGIVAVVVGAIAGGISSFTMAGVNPLLVFAVFAIGILVLGVVLDRAAGDALRGPRK